MEYTSMITILLVGGGILFAGLAAVRHSPLLRRTPTPVNPYQNAYEHFDCGVARVSRYYAQRATNCATGSGWCNQPNCNCLTITHPPR